MRPRLQPSAYHDGDSNIKKCGPGYDPCEQTWRLERDTVKTFIFQRLTLRVGGPLGPSMAAALASRLKVTLLLAFSVVLAAPVTHAAQVAMRLHDDDGQYANFPDSYPVCKSNIDFMHFDGTPSVSERGLFNTKTALLATPLNSVGTYYTGNEVVARIRSYEDIGWEVYGCWVYREDWISTNAPGGDYPADWRVLSTNEIANIRNAIKNASPPLRCKNTVKIIQLLTKAGTASQFPYLEEEILNRFKSLDGLGVECHIGDHEGARQDWAEGMAMISRWAQDNSKAAFVFMGGGADTYGNLPRTQLTYTYLWKEMLARGIDYRASNIIYFRQGAWPGGKHTPESAFDTLTHQQRWVINTLAANGTSLYINEVPDQTMNADTALTVSFDVGKAELPATALVVSAVSSNPTLVSNATLRVLGRGVKRAVSILPNPSRTGTATITLSVNDGLTNVSTSFLLTVTPQVAIASSSSGSINNSNTWSGLNPVPGDTGIWQTGANKITMIETNNYVFFGGTLEVQTNGQFAPGIPGANLTLNKLILNGGTIAMANNIGLVMNLSGEQFTLNRGAIKSGNGPSMGVTFQNGSLAGAGNINITGVGTGGAEVQFASSINTLGFSGVFTVATNGVLDLPPILADDASFGLNLSGTGRYANDADVALTSLVINGTNFLPGIYTYTSLSNFNTFLVTNTGTITVVSTTNTAPTLTAQANRTLIAGQTLTLTNAAADADVPAQTLTFSLLTPLAGATVTSNGVFTWRPTIAQSLSTNVIKVKVTDDGSPNFSATNSFSVTVIPPAKPVINETGWNNGQFKFTVSGTSGPDYTISVSSNLINWMPVWTNTLAAPPFQFTDAISSNFNQRFYRVLLGP